MAVAVVLFVLLRAEVERQERASRPRLLQHGLFPVGLSCLSAADPFRLSNKRLVRTHRRLPVARLHRTADFCGLFFIFYLLQTRKPFTPEFMKRDI